MKPTTKPTRKCAVIGCTELVRGSNAQYCEKHATERTRESWRRSKEKKMLEQREMTPDQLRKIQYRAVDNVRLPGEENREVLSLLRDIRRDTRAILQKLGEQR